MLKKIFFIAGYIMLSASTFASSNSPVSQQFTLHFYNVKSHHKGVTDQQCKKSTTKAYTFSTRDKVFDFGGGVKVVNVQFLPVKEKHGIISQAITGVLEAKFKGRLVHSKIYYRSLRLPKRKTAFGVFSEGVCNGRFRMTYVPIAP